MKHTAPHRPPEDRVLLEGPQSRGRDLWLVLRALKDFVTGFRGLHFVGPCVTVFGSARFDENHPYYTLSRQVGGRLAKMGFTVMTGGGPGLMEAANRGAKDAGGRSVACNITLPNEEDANPYLDHAVQVHYFFVRKVLLFKYSYAFIALPGGFGTMDELFEALTLVQTGKIESFPIVLMGTSYWRRLLHLIHSMEREGTISPRDLRLWLTTDSLDQAMDHIRTHAVDRFGLLERRGPRPSRILGEPRVTPRPSGSR
ncbi:MAG: TIGR00730 family Rossman fold protein [Acidobacteriota bacterium]|nr:TIGR00730 family Rossman fold protein [Acidobacteriota bacterium]